MVGNPVSPQKFPAASPCVHVSFVYLTSKFIFLLMLMSPRILSWRVLIGSSNEETQLVAPVVLGRGKNCNIAKPAGLSLAAGILLPGKASPVRGSCGSGSVSAPLKSPTLSAAVGTFAESTTPRSSRRHSSFQKKKILFFLIGPLKLKP